MTWMSKSETQEWAIISTYPNWSAPIIVLYPIESPSKPHHDTLTRVCHVPYVF